jgi:hypothetical protein
MSLSGEPEDGSKMSQICTLLTDFGEKDSYVAAMKGVLLSKAPALSLVDLSHDISPQDVFQGSYFWGGAIPYYPEGTVHLGVIDPGVGTRRKVCVAVGGGQILVCPDNGLLTHWWRETPGARAYQVDRDEFWNEKVSSTFHGRDIFAPMAGALAAGNLGPEDCGPEIQPILLELPQWSTQGRVWTGVVVNVDHFGNCITSIPGHAVLMEPGEVILWKDGTPLRRVSTYGEAEKGELVILEGSSGQLEYAVNQGNAQIRLGLNPGDEITLTLGESTPS